MMPQINDDERPVMKARVKKSHKRYSINVGDVCEYDFYKDDPDYLHVKLPFMGWEIFSTKKFKTFFDIVPEDEIDEHRVWTTPVNKGQAWCAYLHTNVRTSGSTVSEAVYKMICLLFEKKIIKSYAL